MLFCLFASFHKHVEETDCFFAFFIVGDYRFYGVASVFEAAFSHPLVYLFDGFLGESELNLSQPVHRKQKCLQTI